MIYLDATVFIYAAIDNRIKGNKARNIIKSIQEGKLNAFTSCLTYDEIVWIVKKYKGIEAALIVGNGFINMPNLKIFNVDINCIEKAQELIEKYKLFPRDAIHAATAILNNVIQILSEDKDFDRVEELKRKTLLSLS